MPALSVIVPAYNASRWLDSCVRSILNSTFADLELIIVNDGSTDNTPAMADSYAAADARVRVLHTANGGLSCARNSGMAVAGGRWYTFVDADDTVHPNLFARLVRAATSTGAPIVTAGVAMTEGAMRDDVGDEPCVLAADDMIVRVLRQRDYTYNNAAWAKLYDSSLFAGGRGFTPGTAYEDLDLVPRLYHAAGRVAVLRSPLYHYRQHDEAFTHRFTPGRLDVLRVTAMLEQWTARVGTPAMMAAARDRRFSAAFNVYNMLCCHTPDTAAADLRGHGAGVVTDVAAVKAECWHIIRGRRGEVLRSNAARLKNRVGAVLSYTGQAFVRIVARLASK